MAIKFENLKIGTIIASIRTEEKFKVINIGTINNIELVSQKSGDTKTLTFSTIGRWYREVSQPESIIIPPQPVEPEREPEIKLEPPIQTAKQSISKKVKNNCTKETPITKLRQKLIQRCADELPGITIKVLNNYTALAVEKMNFVEIGFGRNKFTITTISKGLRPAQIKRCNVAPDSYGWTLDARYVVFSENQFEEAMDLIRSSFVYRIRNKRVSGGKKKK